MTAKPNRITRLERRLDQSTARERRAGKLIDYIEHLMRPETTAMMTGWRLDDNGPVTQQDRDDMFEWQRRRTLMIRSAITEYRAVGGSSE